MLENGLFGCCKDDTVMAVEYQLLAFAYEGLTSMYAHDGGNSQAAGKDCGM